MRAGDDVLAPQRGADADGTGLLADGRVERARDAPAPMEVLDLQFDRPHELHPAVELEGVPGVRVRYRGDRVVGGPFRHADRHRSNVDGMPPIHAAAAGRSFTDIRPGLARTTVGMLFTSSADVARIASMPGFRV